MPRQDFLKNVPRTDGNHVQVPLVFGKSNHGTLRTFHPRSARPAYQETNQHVELTSAALGMSIRLTPRSAPTSPWRKNSARAGPSADERLRTGEGVTPLTGIPFGVKDCLSTKGVRTTCSSKILENYVPQYNATVMDRLAEAGAC